MGSLFGGSKSSSSSYNKAYDELNSSLSPMLGYATQGASGLSSLLSGNTTGLKNYENAMGYDWTLNNGLGSTYANAASKGLGDSGSTLKALASYQTGLNNTYADNYVNSLTGLSNLGLSAGNTISSAGNTSSSSSTSSPGISGLLGGLLSGVATGGTSTLASGLKTGISNLNKASGF